MSDIEPATYSRLEGFVFDLAVLLRKGGSYEEWQNQRRVSVNLEDASVSMNARAHQRKQHLD